MANIVSGDMIIDENGVTRWVNDFDFQKIKRFYQVKTHQPGMVRAWLGSQTEDRYIYASGGSALVVVVNPESGETEKFVLTSLRPRILWVPAGAALGYKMLDKCSSLIFFSTLSAEESKKDEVVFPENKWKVFKND